MERLLTTLSVTVVLSWTTAQLCYDAAGNSFAGNDVAYFLDQRHNCTIMICRNGTPEVLKTLCERKLNETMLQGTKPQVETHTGEGRGDKGRVCVCGGGGGVKRLTEKVTGGRGEWCMKK